MELRHCLLDLRAGELERIGLREELAEEGRALGIVYLVDGDGTLVLVTPSLEEAGRNAHWNRDPSIVPELWVRKPDGALVRIAATRHYEGFRDGKVLYWLPGDREHHASDVRRRVTRTIRDPRLEQQPPILKARASSDGATLELHAWGDEGWITAPLDLDPASLR